MESRLKVLGHPLHQMLIVFPLGLLGAAAIFDLLFVFTGNGALASTAHYMKAAGIIGGLLAAPAGLVDWLAIPAGTRAKRVGAVHGLGNVVVLGLFAGSWLLGRGTSDAPPTAAVALAVGGLGLAVVTGWLGGEMVSRLSVGVDDGANLDAPSSLTGNRPRV